MAIESLGDDKQSAGCGVVPDYQGELGRGTEIETVCSYSQ